MEDVESMIRGVRAAGMDVTSLVNEVGKDTQGNSFTGLMSAAAYEHIKIVQYLIYHAEADITITNCDGWGALHYAAQNNKRNTETIKLLLDNMTVNAINHKDKHERTALDRAYKNKHCKIEREIVALVRHLGGKQIVETKVVVVMKRTVMKITTI